MTAQKRYPVSFLAGCMLLLVSLFNFPANASAETSLFLSIVEELEALDLKKLKNLKLSAKLKADKTGKMVFQCLNLSVPVADNPFEKTGKWIRFSQFEVKAVKKGVVARVAFSF
jgi:hypothetical protein